MCGDHHQVSEIFEIPVAVFVWLMMNYHIPKIYSFHFEVKTHKLNKKSLKQKESVN